MQRTSTSKWSGSKRSPSISSEVKQGESHRQCFAVAAAAAVIEMGTFFFGGRGEGGQHLFESALITRTHTSTHACILETDTHTHIPLHSFTPSLLHSLTPSLPHSLTPSLLHSPTPSLLHSFTPSIAHSCTPSYCSTARRGLVRAVLPSLMGPCISNTQEAGHSTC